MNSVSAHDCTVLRDLAGRVRVVADAPAMEQLRQRWRRHNSMQSEVPLVVVTPQGCWPELVPDQTLQCQDPELRRIEWTLRCTLYQREVLKDDSPIDPFFDIGWRITRSSYGFDIPMVYGDNRGSYAWDPPMKDLSRDLEKLHHRTFSVDRQETLRQYERLSHIFSDLLPVRIHSSLWWTLGLTWDAALLVGLENLMWAMYDQPTELHRLMEFLRDDAMNYITWCEQEGLLCANDGSDIIGSGGYGAIEGLRSAAKGDDMPVSLSERWGFAESQETVGVSPAMFEEFILPYQIPLLEKFGLNCYGCCEGLEHRIGAVIRQVPRLRRVSVAPAANQEVLAEALGGKCIFSRKPHPTHVCVGFNERAIREDLRHTLRLMRGHPLELIMKDTHTVENDPSRLIRWVQIAREEIEKTT